MNNNLTKITLFGELGKYIGSETWELNIKSVKEGLSAINILTKNKFIEFFIKNKKLQTRYRILINGKDFISPYQELNEKNWYFINESELIIKKNNLKTIDIVPIIESNKSGGGKGILSAVLGIVLIVAAIALGPIGAGLGFVGGGFLSGTTALGVAIAGLGLLGSGVVAMLSKPPTFSYSQDLSSATSQSYLFNSPVNTVGEGNPVPIGYGTFLVGSNVISAGYKITQFQTFNAGQ